MAEHVAKLAIGVGKENRFINRRGIFEADEFHQFIFFGAGHFVGHQPADHGDILANK